MTNSASVSTLISLSFPKFTGPEKSLSEFISFSIPRTVSSTKQKNVWEPSQTVMGLLVRATMKFETTLPSSICIFGLAALKILPIFMFTFMSFLNSTARHSPILFPHHNKLAVQLIYTFPIRFVAKANFCIAIYPLEKQKNMKRYFY